MLIGYTIRIREKRQERYMPLKNFDGNNNDLGKEITEFLKNHQGHIKIEEVGDKRSIFYGDLGNFDNNKGIIQCKAFVGSFGDKYDIVNMKQHIVDYTLKPEDSYGFPLNFMLKIQDLSSKTSDFGIIVFEKYKKHGAKGLFEEQFSKYFMKKFPDHIVEIEFIVPEEVLNYIKNGKITETTLKSYKVPADISDSYEAGTDSRKKAKIELKIFNMDLKSSLRTKILALINKKEPGKLSQVITGHLIEPNEISLTIEYKGSEKNIIIKEEGETMTPGIDVTKQVINKSGDPLDNTKLFEAEYKYLIEIEKKLNNEVR